MKSEPQFSPEGNEPEEPEAEYNFENISLAEENLEEKIAELEEKRERLKKEIENYEGPRYEDELERSKQVKEEQSEIEEIKESYDEYREVDRKLISLDLEKKKEKLREYAKKEGLSEDECMIFQKEEAEKPWETDELMIAIDADYYSKVIEWLEDTPDTEIDYSCGGRMAAYDKTPHSGFRDFTFFERNEEGERIVRFRHDEFKQFVEKHEYEVPVPTPEEIQKKIDNIDTSAYERTLEDIKKELAETEDGERVEELAYLKEQLEKALIFIDIGVERMKEEYNLEKNEGMTDKETNYADIVYNADTFLASEEWPESIPPEDRLDFGIDQKKMEKLCREFGQELIDRGVYK